MILKRLAIAIAYVTAIPIGRLINLEGDWQLRGLGKYLPWVGLLVGIILVAINALIIQITTKEILHGALIAVCWLALTGSIHMDGLMDTADGIFSHQSRERMLEIMQDSRVGNFGVLSGICLLLLKVVSLVSLAAHPQVMIPALIITPIAARWAELYTIGRFPYARLEGKGQVWHESTNAPFDYVLGGFPMVAAAIALLFFYPYQAVLVPTGGALLTGALAAHSLARKLGGHTGDSYGAVVELAECGALLTTALVLAK